MKRDWVEIWLVTAMVITTTGHIVGSIWLMLGQPFVSHLLRVSFAVS